MQTNHQAVVEGNCTIPGAAVLHISKNQGSDKGTMSLSELTADRLRRYELRHLRRRLLRSRSRFYRSVRRTERRLVRMAAAWYSRQYFLATATADLRLAASRNENVFLGSVLAGLLLAYAFVASAAQLLLFSFQSMTAVSDITGLSMAFLAAVTIGVLATCTGWLLGFIINSLSFAALDGANRKHSASLRATLRRSLSLASRYTFGCLMLWSIVGAGLLVIALPSLIYAFGHYRHAAPSGWFVGLNAALLLAALYALSSFALIPQVMTHEAALPFWQAPLRSYQLLRRRGRLFVLALAASALAAAGAGFGVSYAVKHTFNFASDIIFYFLATAIVITANLVLTMLYRKRKLARSR